MKLRLVVGGGKASDFPKLRPGDIAMNIDGVAIPDVQGDINHAPFASGIFAAVYFEKVPFSAFSGKNIGAVQEAARLLEPDGRIVIETGEKAPIDEIAAVMRQVGFRYVRVSRRGFLRVSGKLRRT